MHDSRGQSMAMGRVGSWSETRVLRWVDGIWTGVAGLAFARPGTNNKIPPSLRYPASCVPAAAGFSSLMENIAPRGVVENQVCQVWLENLSLAPFRGGEIGWKQTFEREFLREIGHFLADKHGFFTINERFFGF